jgi:hypothetical protein
MPVCEKRSKNGVTEREEFRFENPRAGFGRRIGSAEGAARYRRSVVAAQKGSFLKIGTPASRSGEIERLEPDYRNAVPSPPRTIRPSG